MNQLTIVVEGPDGAGKTTLIEQLAYAFPGQQAFQHHGAYLDEPSIAHHYLTSLLPAWEAKVAQQRLTTVLDRSWLAEPIYAEAMRGGDARIATWERRMLERVLLGVGGVVILCLPPLSTCHRAWASRRDREYLDGSNKLEVVWLGYFNAARAWSARGLTVLVHDYEIDPKLERLMPLLRHLLKVHANEGPGAGGWRKADWLLIGDKPNIEGPRPCPPFVSTHLGGCSAWLTEQLETWGLPESRLHWINQFDIGGAEFASFGGVHARFKGQVVALGRVAEQWCETHQVRHYHVVPHPQFWKRFHHHKTYPLRDILLQEHSHAEHATAR